MRHWLLGLLALTLTSTFTYSQQRVDPRFTYHRVYCIVPIVGGGSSGEPLRPDHVPLPGPAAQNGIIAFYHEVSDDGHWALAEIVARDRASLLPILNDNRPGVWVAEKGRVSRQEIQAVFERLKKNFDLDHFGVTVR